MSSKSGAVKIKDIKNGKIFWEVPVYINGDGEVFVKEPSRLVILTRPFPDLPGDPWMFGCSQVIDGERNGLYFPWLEQYGIKSPGNVMPVCSRDGLFKTQRAAQRYADRMADYIPMSEEILDAFDLEQEQGAEEPLPGDKQVIDEMSDAKPMSLGDLLRDKFAKEDIKMQEYRDVAAA